MAVTVADIDKWTPAPAQTIHGYQVFASRLIREGVRFEEAGNKEQAELRYLRAKAYCKLRNLPWPPFALKPTEILAKVSGTDNSVEFVKGEKHEMPPKAGKRTAHGKRGRAAWSGDRAAAKVRGQHAYFGLLVSRGQLSEARTFAAKHGLALSGAQRAAVTPSDDARVGRQNGPDNVDVKASSEPSSGAPMVREGDPATLATSPEAGSAKHETGAPEAPAAPQRPFSIEPSPEELAAMFPDMADKLGVKTSSGATGSDDVEAGPSSVVTGSVVAPDPSPVAAEAASDVTPKPSAEAPPEPRERTVRILNEPTMWTAPRVIRPAIIFSIPRNPRLVAIKLLDTDTMESMWRKPGDVHRVNERMEVVYSEGPANSAIFEEVRKT